MSAERSEPTRVGAVPAPFDGWNGAGADPIDTDKRVVEVLEEARRLGFLGPGRVFRHIDHALGFRSVLLAAELPTTAVPATCVDLGSGGGLPGLVLAISMPSWSFTLVDGNERRTAFLVEAVEVLRLGARCTVVCGRAEEIGWLPAFRGQFDAVVARSFAPPAVTAECAAPLLRVGGTLVVSEPPVHDPMRWPDAGMSQFGFGVGRIHEEAASRLFVSTLLEPVPDRFPRRVGIPAKRPLF